MQNKYWSKYLNKYWNKYSMQNKYFLLHDCVIWRVRQYFMACANTTIVTVKRSLTIIVVKCCKRFPNYPLLPTVCVCTSLYLQIRNSNSNLESSICICMLFEIFDHLISEWWYVQLLLYIGFKARICICMFNCIWICVLNCICFFVFICVCINILIYMFLSL